MPWRYCQSLVFDEIWPWPASVSHYEGCPNVVLEAMACGCPVVVSNIPAHREILDEATAPGPVNPDDPQYCQAYPDGVSRTRCSPPPGPPCQRKGYGTIRRRHGPSYSRSSTGIFCVIRKVFNSMETVLHLNWGKLFEGVWKKNHGW